MPADFGILIVTLKRRRPFLDRLMHRLSPQLSPRVEVFTLEDEGAETIGAKRQRMLHECDQGIPYLAFIDDDDLVAETYCADILAALDQDPDVVGFRLRYYQEGQLSGHSVHSVTAGNPRSERARGERLTRHYRQPNHLNPTRAQWAREIGFLHKNHGEDADFANRMKLAHPDRREVFIDKVLYQYLYRHPHRRVESEGIELAPVPAGV